MSTDVTYVVRKCVNFPNNQGHISCRSNLIDLIECKFSDCGGLSKPFHGTVSAEQTTFGQMASYSCDSGYKISGTSKRICQTDGSWSGQVPTCLPKGENLV